MLEQFKPYNLEQAQKEAAKMQDKIKSGEASNYNEAEKIAEKDEGIVYFMEHLNQGDIEGALKTKNYFNLSDETVWPAAEKRIGGLLSNIYFNHKDVFKQVNKIKEKFNLPAETIQQIAKEMVHYYLAEGNGLCTAIGIKKELNLSKEAIASSEIQQAAKKRLIGHLKNSLIDSAIKDTVEIKKEFNLPEEFINSFEVQQIIKERLTNQLSGIYFNFDAVVSSVDKIRKKLNLHPELVHQAVKEVMAKRLLEGGFREAIKFKERFNLPPEVISSQDVQLAAEEAMFKSLSQHYFSDAIIIKNKFNLPKEVVLGLKIREAITAEIVYRLGGGIDDVIKNIHNIKEGFNLTEDFIFNTEIQQALKAKIANFLRRFDEADFVVKKAIEFKNEFNLSPEIILSPEVQDSALHAMINYLSLGKAKNAFKIKEEFGVSDEKANEVVGGMIVSSLHEGHVEAAIEIKDVFNLPKKIIQDYGKRGFFLYLEKGFYGHDGLFRIKESFELAVSSQEIIQKNSQLGDLIDRVSQMVPEFRVQVEKSPDLAIELLQFIRDPDSLISILEENPLLIDALANNTRFSPRLLMKFPKFDKPSKENIEKLYSVKKKIMEKNPELDPESLEFRQLMQEELKEFKNNPEIMAEIEKQGINLDEWLNYSETSYFNLSTGGSEIAFSEKIRTPIDRIKETIDSYAHTIKSVLKEYRPEMEKYEIILEDAKPIEDQIAKMEVALEQAKIEGNEKKVQGIEKGLASQKEKLNNLKKGFLWYKLTGEIAAFQRLKNDCFDAQKRLMEAENKLEGALSGKMPSGKMIQDIKQTVTSSKEELRSKFSDMEGRIEEFKTNLPKLISPCLGQERSEALIQEIDQKVAEQFNHFETDRTTVANLFSERGDKEVGQLESRPMSIFVWARNPDIDLYQGNYSPCCISIETGSGGGTSTSAIADFNTDLGVQIVNIWDETKNEPVTAAWCWLGKDDEGKTALVVDNIESNTLYSANFSEQLSDELLDYIKNYAKKVGVNKVVLGKVHNDLPTASKVNEMEKDKAASIYEKVGGYNREEGYYLEAQMYGTKIIQENEKKIIEKEKTESVKIEFKEIKIESVSENNLMQIVKAERKIYAGTGLISGQIMVEDIKRGNGFEYSVAMTGVRPGKKQAEIVAYIVAVEDETDEGDKSIYMEDIAVLPEAQRQGIGWEAMKEFIGKLKAKAVKDGQLILLDMHLRETSQIFMANHHANLESLGVKLIEEALVPDYYDEGEDALYQVYQIKAD